MTVTEQSRVIERDVLKVAPEQYRTLFENDRVRVLELRLSPGEEIPMHSHPATIAYFFEDASNVWTLLDGRIQDVDMKAGQVFYSGAFAHSVVNTGTTETHVLITEIKKP